MHYDEIINDGWRFFEGDIEEKRPTDKTPVYWGAKTETKRSGPASYYYVDNPDAFTWSAVEANSIGWKEVSLPHDYMVNQVRNKKYNAAHGYFDYKNAWYRRNLYITKEDEGKRITLYFEGIAQKATIYVNGCLAKRSFSSYKGIEVDLTDFLFYDAKKKNVVAVYVNTEDYEGWWYQGGGIYRNVHLVKTDKTYIDMWGVYVKPVKMDGNNWNVNLETTVCNSSFENSDITVKSEINDKDGKTVAVAETVGSVGLRDSITLKYAVTVKNPNIWDTENPYLYTVNTCVYNQNGEEIDTNKTRTGFRTLEFDKNKGFFLNGKHTLIKGVCGHQDFGITGLAIPDNISRYKIKLLKEMGANGYRTSHYPYSIATMDALDEAGFLVMDETRWFSTNDEAIENLKDLVKRDRNRPSVIFWSTGNEEKFFDDVRGENIAKTMHKVVYDLDDTRFVVNAVDRPIGCTTYASDDVVGINYHYEDYDKVRELYPEKAFIASECCASATTRGCYFDYTKETEKFPSYDHFGKMAWSYASFGREEFWQFMLKRPYVSGYYQWTGIDYRGESLWPRLGSQSGSIDMFLQKKDAFYQNKSLWTAEPMLHIVPHWNFEGLEGEIIKVFVYNNCEEVELLVNGKTLGKQRMGEKLHGEWQVPYEKGTLTALGFKDGKEVVRETVATTGKPVKLCIKRENEASNNGRDVIVYTCYCVDENNREVPDAAETVKFWTDGGGQLLGTGSDICDNIPPESGERKMWAGKITVAVKVKAKAECVKLYAKSQNLGLAVCTAEF